MNVCVLCNDPTDSAQQAGIGDQAGPICEACAEWCDGNIIKRRD